MFNNLSQIDLFDGLGSDGFIPNCAIQKADVLNYTLKALRRGNDNPTRRSQDRNAVGRALRRLRDSKNRGQEVNKMFRNGWVWPEQTQIRLFHEEEFEDYEFDAAIKKITDSNKPMRLSAFGDPLPWYGSQVLKHAPWKMIV